ncbi:MAG TPA: hypothetical protein VFS20_19000 [Longimicrobium sp.]|nr:hypothetical protein [Longimicrobium sp.]
MARKSTPASNPKKALSGRRAATPRSNGKLSKDEVAFREELVKGFRAIRGMQIDDLYPPSDQDEIQIYRTGREIPG